MAKDVQTNLKIALSTKGFDEGLRKILGVTQKAVDSMKQQALGYGKVQDQITKVERKVQSLSKVQLSAHRNLEKITDKTSEAYKKEEARLKKAEDLTRKLQKEAMQLAKAHKLDADAMEKLTRAQRELLSLQQREQREQQRQQQQRDRAARGGFTQGFIQASGIGGTAGLFMQRGPGMWRQAAGMAAGGMARRGRQAAGGLLGGGVEGMQAALSAIPGAGPIAAAQLGQAAQNADAALQWQRQRVQLAPMFGIATGKGGTTPAVRAPVKPSREPAREAFRSALQAAAAPGQILNEARPFLGLSASEDQQLQAQIQGTAPTAVRRPRQTAFITAGRLGRRYMGLSRQEAAQEVGAMYQVAGGRFQGGRQQRLDVGAAMAAQTMYGVSGEAAGAFLGAGRRGGLVGGRGNAAGAITGALSDAVSMGLEGSEITRYMQQVAQGIQQFQQTGIPMNKDSLKNMGVELSKAGIGGVRGTAMAGGLQRYVQGIGQRGITGGMDLMMMQAFGGFKGGGAQDYEKAILQMESMQGAGLEGVKKGTPMGDLVQRLVKMGGGARGGGVTFMRKAMGRAGMQMSMGEAMAMTERLTGEQLMTEEERKAFGIDVKGEGARRGKSPQTPQQLMAAAAQRITDLGPNIRKQADLMDKQLAIGEGILTTVQTLKDSSLTLNDTFTKLAGPTLQDFSKTIKGIIEDLDKFLKGKSGFMDLIGKLNVGGT